jgi:hypothetical protein
MQRFGSSGFVMCVNDEHGALREALTCVAATGGRDGQVAAGN